MNFLVTLVAYLTIFPLSVWSANQNTSLFTNVIETDFEIATATTPFSLNYNPGGATPVYFYFFPCFGSFDLRIDSLNPSGTICSINWDSSSLVKLFSFLKKRTQKIFEFSMQTWNALMFLLHLKHIL